MSVSVRQWAVPAAALAATAVFATATSTSPPHVVASAPKIRVEDVALAGIGQDIYNAVTPVVQYVIGGGSYLVNFVPLVGGPTAAQININYFQLIQPVIAATVNYLAGVVQDPLNLIPTTQAYGVTLYDIGYNYVSAQLRFLGLRPPAPLPPIAASARAPRGAAAVRSTRPGRSKAATTGSLREFASTPRRQSRTVPAAARTAARAGAAAAAKPFG